MQSLGQLLFFLFLGHSFHIMLCTQSDTVQHQWDAVERLSRSRKQETHLKTELLVAPTMVNQPNATSQDSANAFAV